MFLYGKNHVIKKCFIICEFHLPAKLHGLPSKSFSPQASQSSVPPLDSYIVIVALGKNVWDIRLTSNIMVLSYHVECQLHQLNCRKSTMLSPIWHQPAKHKHIYSLIHVYIYIYTQIITNSYIEILKYCTYVYIYNLTTRFPKSYPFWVANNLTRHRRAPRRCTHCLPEIGNQFGQLVLVSQLRYTAVCLHTVS